MANEKQVRLYSPDQVRALLERMAHENPERWRAAIHTVILNLFEAFAPLHGPLIMVLQALESQMAQASGEQPQADAAPAVSPPPQPSAPAKFSPTGERLGADGTPLSPEQAAIEALMDSAEVVPEAAPAPAPAPAVAPKPAAPAPRQAPPSSVRKQGQGQSRPQQPPPRQRPVAPPAVPPPAVPQAETRVGADGTPLSPEQAAIEAQMDQATRGG